MSSTMTTTGAPVEPPRQPPGGSKRSVSLALFLGVLVVTAVALAAGTALYADGQHKDDERKTAERRAQLAASKAEDLQSQSEDLQSQVVSLQGKLTESQG